MIKKIAIVGPESTGKTTLSEQLAKHYKTSVVPEYAREYLNQVNRKYTLRDIEIIAQKQMKLEEELMPLAKSFLFCDTNLIVCKIWAEHVFKQCPEWIQKEIEQRTYDYYLLTDIDLPWEADPLREHPQLRNYFLNRYKEELQQQKASYCVVSGHGQQRIACAIAAINKLI